MLYLLMDVTKNLSAKIYHSVYYIKLLTLFSGKQLCIKTTVDIFILSLLENIRCNITGL